MLHLKQIYARFDVKNRASANLHAPPLHARVSAISKRVVAALAMRTLGMR